MPDGGVARSALPAGLAPRYLTREQAAAYLGVSADTFAWEVEQGHWPAAVRRGRKGGLVTWDRLALDDRADLRSGRCAIDASSGAEAAQLADAQAAAEGAANRLAAEALAMKGVRHASRQRPGTKSRQAPQR